MLVLDILDEEELTRRADGDYVGDVAETAWRAWQAARPAAGAPVQPSVQQIVDLAHAHGKQDMRVVLGKDDFIFKPRQLVEFSRALAAAPVQPQTEYPYDALFRAIGDAAKIQGGALSISVKQFVETLASNGYAISAPVQSQPPFAHFVQPSGFGPFIECESSQVGCFPAYRAAPLQVSGATSDEPIGEVITDKSYGQLIKWYGNAPAVGAKLYAAPVIRQSLLRPAISVANPMPPGCYCPPNECQAPKIMGRQTPCRRKFAAPTPTTGEPK